MVETNNNILYLLIYLLIILALFRKFKEPFCKGDLSLMGLFVLMSVLIPDSAAGSLGSSVRWI